MRTYKRMKVDYPWCGSTWNLLCDPLIRICLHTKRYGEASSALTGAVHNGQIITHAMKARSTLVCITWYNQLLLNLGTGHSGALVNFITRASVHLPTSDYTRYSMFSWRECVVYLISMYVCTLYSVRLIQYKTKTISYSQREASIFLLIICLPELILQVKLTLLYIKGHLIFMSTENLNFIVGIVKIILGFSSNDDRYLKYFCNT